MNPLIAINQTAIADASVQTVNARDLHDFLGSNRQFADWIKERIQSYGFVENQDFILISQNCEIKEGRGGDRRSTDYAITLDMAKELSMVERTAKGKQARQYFIECERRAKAGGQTQRAKPQPPLKQLSDAARAFKAVFQSLRILDLNTNAAAISANQAVRQQTNLDFLALTGNTHLKAENQQSLHYTPTQLGEQLGGLSGKQINRALQAAGLQEKQGKDWQPTDQGRPHAFIADTGKAHSSGIPIQQLKWYDSVLPLIDNLIHQKEAA